MMTDMNSKRNSMGGRTAVPIPRAQQGQTQNQNLPLMPLDEALRKAVGAKIRVKLANIDVEHIGEVVNVSSMHHTLSIAPSRPEESTTANANSSSSNGSGIVMINISAIESFRVLELTPVAASSAAGPRAPAASLIPSLTNIEVERTVRGAVGKALDEEANQGKGVTSEAQEFYDAVRRLFPIRWGEHGAFIVNENALVEPPYGPESCRLVDGVTSTVAVENALTGVKKVRKKIADRKGTKIPPDSEKRGG